MSESSVAIAVRNLTAAYGDEIVLRDVSFEVGRGEVFVVMGGSGSGKSTLMRHMVGLEQPREGRVLYDGVGLWEVGAPERESILRRCGVMYQGGALWSSMTLAENVALPLEYATSLSPRRVRELVRVKLALVGLTGFGDYYPSEISGGMRTRAGLARAMALDPDILFFDEPTAGLDPVRANRMDDLIVELRDSLRTTVVIVTHRLPTIFAVATNSVFLDGETKTVLAQGDPRRLREECEYSKVREFLTGEEAVSAGDGAAASARNLGRREEQR
ncbi:MAG: ABC transporter ATP-binding protein [Planctomycetota bacterium]